jgi:WhiB family redox-sensing transcriptional regulator
VSWRKQAACTGYPIETFFGDDEHGLRGSAARAKAICSICPVRNECLEENIFEEFGVFGGLTHRERITLRARRKLMKPTTVAPHGTQARARWHYRHNVPICQPCLMANARANSESKERRRDVAS